MVPGGTATLRLHSQDLKNGFELKILLRDIILGSDVDSRVKLVVSGDQSRVAVPMPKEFVHGSLVMAILKGALDDGTKLEQVAAAPLFVRNEMVKPAPAPAGGLEKFFEFKGTVGERESPKDHTVMNPDADEQHRYTHAIFADMGGFDDPHFGEGSPALGQKVHAAGLADAKLLYIIYPQARGRGRSPPPTRCRRRARSCSSSGAGWTR